MFTHTGTGSGTIDEVSFSDAEFTITAEGDTDNRDQAGPTFFIDHDLASITISGVGTLDFVTATRSFVNPNMSLVGFSRAGPAGVDVFNGPTAAVFDTWDMLDSIGPISGTGVLESWTVTPIVTDGGVLIFFDETVGATFQAVVIPEPASLIPMLIGLAVLAVASIRRQLRAAGVARGACMWSTKARMCGLVQQCRPAENTARRASSATRCASLPGFETANCF